MQLVETLIIPMLVGHKTPNKQNLIIRPLTCRTHNIYIFLSPAFSDEKLEVNVARGTFSQLQNVQVEQLSHSQAEQLMVQKGRQNPVSRTAWGSNNHIK